MPSVPPSFNYPDPLRLIPEIGFDRPAEGPNGVDIVLDWAVPLSRGLDAYGLNFQTNTTLALSQICGLVIDNSDSGADLDFIFPDTDTTISIPAYAPYTVLPVFTRSLQFFVRIKGGIAGDRTNLRVLNYSPRPVAVPITKQQLTAGIANETLDGTSTIPIISPGINGTLENVSVTVAFPKPSVSFNNLLTLRAGNGKILWAGNIAAQDDSSGGSFTVCNLQGVSLRFVNGVVMTQTGGFSPGGTISANLYFKTP